MSVAGRDATSALDGVGETAPVGDRAIAETTLPLSVAEARAFLSDIPRLIRLNPQLTIERWVTAEGGFHCAGRNESNAHHFEFGIRVERSGDRLILRYDRGLKRATSFALTAEGKGARLIVTEHYPRIEDAADPRLVEVDKSLVPWVAAIRCHLLARRRWSWLPGWRWWQERFMLSMSPRERRIVRLLLWTTVAEFVVFLGLVAGLRFAA